MALTADEVRYIARLARLALTDDEVERLRTDLGTIFGHFEVLQEIDTEGVPPTAQSLDLSNVTRDDAVRPSLPTEVVLEQAPRREDGYFRVRAVLD